MTNIPSRFLVSLPQELQDKINDFALLKVPDGGLVEIIGVDEPGSTSAYRYINDDYGAYTHSLILSSLSLSALHSPLSARRRTPILVTISGRVEAPSYFSVTLSSLQIWQTAFRASLEQVTIFRRFQDREFLSESELPTPTKSTSLFRSFQCLKDCPQLGSHQHSCIRLQLAVAVRSRRLAHARSTLPGDAGANQHCG